MAQEVVEIIHGKRSKYEVVKDTGGPWSLASTKFVVKKDGKHFRTCSTLRDAVEAAKKEGCQHRLFARRGRFSSRGRSACPREGGSDGGWKARLVIDPGQDAQAALADRR